MPKRTTPLKVGVVMLHRHLAGDATVEESALLPHRITGQPREVDVVIRREVAGYEVIVAVEATRRRGDTPWVESMLQKHAELPTHHLVLIAERGFSRPARELAERKGVDVITPETIAADDGATEITDAVRMKSF